MFISIDLFQALQNLIIYYYINFFIAFILSIKIAGHSLNKSFLFY